MSWAFPFRVKRIGPDLTTRLLDVYARDRDRIRVAPEPSALPRLRFLGSRLLLLTGRKGPELRWRLGEERLRLADMEEAAKGRANKLVA